MRGNLCGFPHSRSITRPQATTFAQQKCCSKKERHAWVSLLFWSGRRGSTRYRHPTNGRAIRRSPAGPLDLTRCAPVEAAISSPPRHSKRKHHPDGWCFFWSGRRGSTRHRHPTNGRAIRRSPAGPPDLTRSAPVEAAISSLPAAFQKENTILTDGVSFWSGRRGSNSLPRPWQGRALPDELRPQAAPLLQRLWCLRPGSNRRHADFQSAALPTELPRHMATKKGLEPSTSSVTGWRSNQLNYLAVWMVGTTGLEPVTPCL